ncbi:Arrestin domain-containing protein 2 [Mortierella alpina]|nr:Arrestin domain-containing protein 2 [Mortierella alpina]
MNFLFSTASGSTSPATHTHPHPHTRAPALSCSTAATAATAASTATAAHSPTTPTPGAQQDVELVIDIESSFHGVLLGLPEDSHGAVLNATAILHVRKKPIRASRLTATFDGRIKVQCSDGATFGSEQYRERVLAHKDWVLWEAGANNIHGTASGSGSKNHIPVGTHYYPLSIQLDGALPPTFSGKHGSIRYILTSTLLRPLFYSDINSVQEIEIKRCLVNESALANGTPIHQSSQLDLGSLLVSQLSRAGISGAINTRSEALEAMAADVPLGPITITHHNTHKELLRYTATSPPIAHLEGGLIQVDLALEPLPPGSYVYSIAYGLKELIYYRSSATGNLADNKSEILYPIGQQTVIIPRDLERERSMSSAGAGASTRQLLELRPCPLLTNVDILTPLIEIHHRITCNVAIVLADTTPSGDHPSDHTTGSSTGGGGILRRLNLAPQPLAPSLNLIDSSGAEAVNNAVLLGEPTLSIIEPALMPATVELNDAPPPPPSSQIESTLLEFPIILTSRYPSSTRGPSVKRHPVMVPDHQEHQLQDAGNEADFAYHALNTHSYPSSGHANPADQHSAAPVLQQFVHNQEIAPTVIPTTGTAVQTAGGPSMASMLSRSISSSSSSSHLSTVVVGDHNNSSSSSSSYASPLTPSTVSGLLPSQPTLLDTPVPNQLMAGSNSHRVLAQSGLSAGLRAAAAAAAAVNPGSLVDSTENGSQSRPPSYGRQGPQATQFGNPSPEELPKYEDVMDQADQSEAGLGIAVPQSIPMPMPMHIPSRGDRSVSPRSLGVSHSPGLHQGMGSHPRGRVLASPPSLSPVIPSTSAGFAYDREVHGSSPPMIRGHARSGSTTSILQSTSLARSPSQSMSPFLTMTPTQSSPLQQQFTAPSSMHRQTSIGHQRQQHHQHQRQRSVGAATIMGSLGRNGGYLSQQPVHLTLSDCAVPSPIPITDRHISPPAYVE